MAFELEQSQPIRTTSSFQLAPSQCPHHCDATTDEVLHRFGEFQISRCGACGLVRLVPRLTESELVELYEREYFSGDHAIGYDTYEQDASLYEKTFARRLKLIQSFKTSGRLLDIGCGLGFFLNVAARRGFDVQGLEMSAYAFERASAGFPGRIHQGLLVPGLFPAKSFDIVTLFDVFEHVYEPRGFIRILDEITNDDAIVCITTPNHRSLLSRVSGRNWISYKIPEHVFYYTPETLRRMVEPLFEIVLLRSEGQYCTLEFLAERLKTLIRPLGSTLLQTVRALHISKWPIYINSGSMTVILKKRERTAH